jgi:hypothetical protein
VAVELIGRAQPVLQLGRCLRRAEAPFPRLQDRDDAAGREQADDQQDEDRFRLQLIATIRSIAPRARSAISGSTLTGG